MTIQITIIGLGQVGGSIGLALAEHKENVKRVGHDKDPEIARAAMKAGAVDGISFNLPASVEQADIIVLAMPLNEVRDTLRYIRDDLKEGAVVLDTSPAKQQVEAWVQELLPHSSHYIGLAPAINPDYLKETGGGLDAAHADLFKDAAFLLCPARGAPEDVARLGEDFVLMLGAKPLFSDAAEVDGLLASMLTLPKLLTISLVDVTAGKPGWKDAGNLAERSYAAMTASTFDRDEADGLRDAALANRVNVIRVLDGTIASLLEMRDAIEREDRAALGKQIHAAYEKGYAWLSERHLEKYLPTYKKANTDKGRTSPSLGGRVRQLFLGNLRLPGSNSDKK